MTFNCKMVALKQNLVSFSAPPSPHLWKKKNRDKWGIFFVARHKVCSEPNDTITTLLFANLVGTFNPLPPPCRLPPLSILTPPKIKIRCCVRRVSVGKYVELKLMRKSLTKPVQQIWQDLSSNIWNIDGFLNACQPKKVLCLMIACNENFDHQQFI